jgi:micrococcal nuclease
MGTLFPKKHSRSRRTSSSRARHPRPFQRPILAFQVGAAMLFCTIAAWGQGVAKIFDFNQASARSPQWMLGSNGADPPQNVSMSGSDATPTPSFVRYTHFSTCRSGGYPNCVVDGDTFWLAGEKIRIADIDTPETHPAHCAAEADLGNRATERLRDLLNAGSFILASIDRDTDKYGRKLRIVERGGSSLGALLVSEGLARPYSGGYRQSWCA